MKRLLFKYWPAITILLIWLVFSSPYFLKGNAPFPAKFQNSFFSPWSDYEEFAVPVKNNALSDVVDQIYPWKHFTIEELKKGRIPLWNPFSFSGNPHVANAQTAVFSPFNLLFFILPFVDAWSISILLQPLFAGLFMLLFLQKLKISKEASLLGSITFMFCGFLVVWMPYGTLSMAIAFLPLALYAVEKSFECPKLFSLLLLSFSLAVSFFSGHFQTSLYFSLFVLAYLFYKFLSTRKKKLTLVVLTSYFLGLILSLIQIIPSLELYNLSVRSGLFSNQGGIPLNYLITSFAPDFFGNPVTRNDWVGNYAEWASFIGIIPLMLAFISFLGKKGNSKITFFFITGIIAILLAMDSPLQTLLSNLKLPVFSTSIPSRIIVLFSFSFAVLAAFGLDTLKNHLYKDQTKKILIIYSALFCLILFIWLLLLVFKVLPADKSVISVRNLLMPTFFLFLAGVLIILSLKIKGKMYIKPLLFSLIIITFADSFRFAQKWMPFDPKELIFPDIPVISAMQKSVGTSGRVLGKFGAYVDTYYRLPAIEGYDPLYIRRYGEFISSAKTGNFEPAVRSLAVLDKNGKYSERVIDLLGVNVMFHVIGDTGKEWAFPVWAKDASGKYKYQVFYQDDKFQLLSNKRALPRAKVFFDYEVIKKDKDIIKRFYSDGFDFKNKLILENDPGIKRSNNIKDAKAKIISYSPQNVVIDVSSPQKALLFLSDNYYPRWKARVNGKEEKVFRTDYTFRSVIIPEGKSKVEFYYSVLF